jgi:hypothetical protein
MIHTKVQLLTSTSYVATHFHIQTDPAELLAEEARKPPCRNLQITGKCEFGPNCRFSHVFQHFPGISLASCM